MVSDTHLKEPESVSCEVCRLEVPHAKSLTIEGKEYMYYFCGHGCYSRWQEGMAEGKKGNVPRSYSEDK